MSIKENPPKGLLFDVFGTCTNWRRTVPAYLATRAHTANPTLAEKVPEQRWKDLAEEWIEAYGTFCHEFKPGETEWRDVDAVYRDALKPLLIKYDVDNFWTPEEVKELYLIWHKLEGWADAGPGIRALNGLGLKTASLSNGNMSLLNDMVVHADLPFTKVVSAENARTKDGHHAYKPNPSVYKHGADELGFKLEECALVAAHLHDLWAAKQLGMKTIFVERELEEEEEEMKKALDKGWVDLWIKESPPGRGFLEVAEKLSHKG